MTRLSELEAEPITPAELSAAVRKGDPTLIRTAVTLRDSWSIHTKLQREKVDADNACLQAKTALEQLGKVMRSKSGEVMTDLVALVAYGKRMKDMNLRLLDAIAQLKAHGGELEAAGNSLETMIEAAEVPDVVTRG